LRGKIIHRILLATTRARRYKWDCVDVPDNQLSTAPVATPAAQSPVALKMTFSNFG
jgi:hypothetical protein